MLEKEQSHVLRQIYGPGVSAKGMRIKANLPLLSARRKSACIKFARKNVENKRCEKWFVERPQSKYPRRSGAGRRVYKERMARTDRLKNSPINYMIRLLNAE